MITIQTNGRQEQSAVEQAEHCHPAEGDFVIRRISIQGETKWLICHWGGGFGAEPLDLEIAKQRTLERACGRAVWIEERRGGAFIRVHAM